MQERKRGRGRREMETGSPETGDDEQMMKEENRDEKKRMMTGCEKRGRGHIFLCLCESSCLLLCVPE